LPNFCFIFCCQNFGFLWKIYIFVKNIDFCQTLYQKKNVKKFAVEVLVKILYFYEKFWFLSNFLSKIFVKNARKEMLKNVRATDLRHNHQLSLIFFVRPFMTIVFVKKNFFFFIFCIIFFTYDIRKLNPDLENKKNIK